MKAIYFAHGNGFPAKTYQQFFAHLRDDYAIDYLNQFGHDPRYSVGENWQGLVQQLIDDVKQRYTKPVIAMGHSLGGGLIYLAAQAQPELFSAVILLDVPLFGRLKYLLLALSKKGGFMEYLIPARSTLQRRAQWPDEQSAYHYLRHKKLFAHFSEPCLWDYIHFGMQKTPQGLALTFSPQIEYEIFCNLPHHLAKFSEPLKMPRAFIYGTDSTVITPYDRKVIKNFYQLPLFAAPGTHTFPFEYPQQAAQQVLAALAK